jgi:biopolymer transport protein ExbB
MKRSLFLFLSLVSLASLMPLARAMAESGPATRIATGAGNPGGGTVTLLQAITSGGWAMIPLALLSILTVMLILGYALTLRRGAIVSRRFMETAEVLLPKGDFSGLLALTHRHDDAVARIARRTLEFITKNPQAPFPVVREIAQTEGSGQAAALQHRITYLADIAVLSPMVGLLGTVTGIIRSFATMAHTASEATRSSLLSGGVSEALFATAAGLIVGITAMAFYGIYRNKVQHLISGMEGAAAHLLALMALSYGALANPGTPPSVPRGAETTRPAKPSPAVSVDDDF